MLAAACCVCQMTNMTARILPQFMQRMLTLLAVIAEQKLPDLSVSVMIYQLTEVTAMYNNDDVSTHQ